MQFPQLQPQQKQDRWKGAGFHIGWAGAPHNKDETLVPDRLWAMSKLKPHVINLSKALQRGAAVWSGDNSPGNPAGPCIPLPSQLQPTRAPKKRTTGTVPVPGCSQPSHLLLPFIENSQPGTVLPRLKMRSAQLKPETGSRASLTVTVCQGAASPSVLDGFRVNWKP